MPVLVSPSAFSWVFDFTYNCVDITESDRNPRVHYYFKSQYLPYPLSMLSLT